MASHATLRRARPDNTPLITGVVIIVLVLASILVWKSLQAQDRLSTLRSGQTAGLAQRTDTQQLTCALWAVLRADSTRTVPAEVRTAADKICSNVPTPAPTDIP